MYSNFIFACFIMILKQKCTMVQYLHVIGVTVFFAVCLGFYAIFEYTPGTIDMMKVSNNYNDIKSIHMGMNMFMPNELHVEPNTTISWQTHDMKKHNVSGIFKTDSGNGITILSGDIDHMEKWSYTFEESGVFEYTCGYHQSEGMKGKLIVS